MRPISKVVIIGHDNYGSREIFSRIVEDNPEFEYLLIITRGLYYGKSYMQSIIKLLTEASLIFVSSRFIDGVIFSLKEDTLKRKATNYNIKYAYSDDVNGKSTFAILKNLIQM